MTPTEADDCVLQMLRSTVPHEIQFVRCAMSQTHTRRVVLFFLEEESQESAVRVESAVYDVQDIMEGGLDSFKNVVLAALARLKQ